MGSQFSRRTHSRLAARFAVPALFVLVAACGGAGSPTVSSSPSSAATTSAPAATATATASPAVSVASPSAQPARGWSIDQASGGGRITGRHCGGPLADWTVDGTYDKQGQKGVQQWVITIDLASLADPGLFLGTFTYTDKAQMTTGPVTVNLDGKSAGDVTLKQDPAGRALMHFEETSHTYRATASGGGVGQDQNAPLAVFDMTWEVDATCP